MCNMWTTEPVGGWRGICDHWSVTADLIKGGCQNYYCCLVLPRLTLDCIFRASETYIGAVSDLLGSSSVKHFGGGGSITRLGAQYHTCGGGSITRGQYHTFGGAVFHV